MRIAISLLIFFMKILNLKCHDTINEYKGKAKKVIKGSSILKLESNFKELDIFKGIYDDKFKEYNVRDIYLDKRNYKKNETYYLKVFIRNNTKKSHLELYGLFKPSDKICCFFDDGNTIETFKNESININLFYSYASIDIQPGEIKKIYIRLKNCNIPSRTSMYITELSKIVESENNYQKINFFLITLTFIFSAVSFLLYLKLKKIYLVFYSIICLSEYLRSYIFISYLQNLNCKYSKEIYAIFSILYIISLIEFIKNILRIDFLNKRFDQTLNNIKYSYIFLVLSQCFNLGDNITLVIIKRWSLLYLFTTVCYISYIRYKEGYKAYFYPFIPYLIHNLLYLLPSVNIVLFTYDIRVAEQFEFFSNIVLIGGILFYELKELLRTKTKLEESETVIATINNSDNLMHSVQNIIELYKDDIKHDKVMFFHRIAFHNGEKLFYKLNYSFSLPSLNDENEEYQKHEQLERFLTEDKFKNHYICNDIENSDLYSKLLKGYKSMIALRLSALNELNLGYLLILSEKKREYEYNDIMKDFRYKVTLVVQHFSAKEDERRKADSLVMTEVLIQDWLSVLNEAVLNTKFAAENVEMLKKLNTKALGTDKQVNKAVDQTVKDLEYRITSVSNAFDFKNNGKLYKLKSDFTFKWLIQKIEYLKESISKLPNCKLEMLSYIDDKQEFYGQTRMLTSVLSYCLKYLYNKIKELDDKVDITLLLKIEKYKLVISFLIEGLNIEEHVLERGYRDENQTRLLEELEGKKELKVEEGKLIISYSFNILKMEDRKDRHLHYQEYKNDEDEDDDSDDDDNDSYIDRDYDEEQAKRDKGVDEVFKKLANTTIHDDIYKD